MPIYNYGERWTWERSGWGQTNSRGRPVNFEEQIGIYILFCGEKAVYVGRACKGRGTIGSRLADHKRSTDKNNWDSFTWFGFRKVDEDGKLEPAQETVVSYEGEIRDMEAVLIYLLDPGMNARSGEHRHLIHYEQLEIDPN